MTAPIPFDLEADIKPVSDFRANFAAGTELVRRILESTRGRTPCPPA